MSRLLGVVVALLAVTASAQTAEVNIIFSPKVELTKDQELHCLWDSKNKALMCVTVQEFLEMVRKMDKSQKKNSIQL